MSGNMITLRFKTLGFLFKTEVQNLLDFISQLNHQVEVGDALYAFWWFAIAELFIMLFKEQPEGGS